MSEVKGSSDGDKHGLRLVEKEQNSTAHRLPMAILPNSSINLTETTTKKGELLLLVASGVATKRGVKVKWAL